MYKNQKLFSQLLAMNQVCNHCHKLISGLLIYFKFVTI